MSCESDSNSTGRSGHALTGLISDDTRKLFELINFVALSGTISFFGMIANVINIIVYVRMGVKDPITISFVALAVSDFFSLITIFWFSICINPLIIQSEHVPFDFRDMRYLMASWPHIGFTRVTGLITVYITIERCLCVTAPLKVGTILTPTRTKLIVTGCYVIVMAGIAPVYYANQYVWKFIPEKNRSMVVIIETDNRMEIEGWVLATVNVGLQYLSFFAIIVCTAILVITLDKKTKWRKSTSAGSDDGLSSRDKKASRMVVLISTIFIVSYIPMTIASATMVLVPDFTLGGRFMNVFFVYWSATFVIEALNSSVNILVYFKMSAKYRETFMETFPLIKSLLGK